MNHRTAITTSLILLTAAISASARTTAAKAFTSAPRQVLSMLDTNTRLDMVDYFNSGMSTPSANNLNGSSAITEMSPESVTVRLTGSSTCQFAVLPCGSDTLIAVITTVATPAPDSKMTVYSSDWKRTLTEKVFDKPALSDWLSDSGRKNRDEVESLVPFMLTSYSYDPATKTLTLTNNTAQFLSEDIYDTIAPYLLSSLSFKWNGKKFTRVK